MRHGSTLPVLETTVVSDWIDYNGHMNDAAYAIAFSRSLDTLMDRIGLDAAARKRTGQTVFTLQMMLHYFKEAKEGDALAVSCQLLEHDDKRMRVLARHDHAGRRTSRRLGAASDLSRAGRRERARHRVELRDQGRARSARQGAERPASSARGRIGGCLKEAGVTALPLRRQN